ncbi:MAG: chemotaxis protein CheD [Planctomycetota bacterium]|jgi:chemotaxis protein CheD
MSPSKSNALVVGVADMTIGSVEDGQIVTYALGSCIGLTAYDPVARVGGLLHFMLPQPSSNSEPKDLKQFMYATTGMPRMFRRLVERGAVQSRLILTATGGAEILEGAAHMAIGKRNRTMMRKVLWKMNMTLVAEDTGGSLARTMSLELETGEVRVRSHGCNQVLWQQVTAPMVKGN